MELTHINQQGRARMVDVTQKEITFRQAEAEGDMCKAVQRDMELSDIRLCRKSGGKTGDYCKEW